GARGGRLRGGGRSRRRRRRTRACAPPSTAGRAARRLAARHERLRRRGRACRRLEPGRSRLEQKRGRSRRRHQTLDRPRLHHEERADGGCPHRGSRGRPMRALRFLLWIGAVALFAVMAARVLRHDLLPPGKAALHSGVGVLGVTVGLLVWELRPDRPMGFLLMAAPIAGALTELDFIFPASALAVTVGIGARDLDAAVYAHAILAYPTGRLASLASRAFVLVA